MTSRVVPDWSAIVEMVVVTAVEQGNVIEEAADILSEMEIVSADAILITLWNGLIFRTQSAVC